MELIIDSLVFQLNTGFYIVQHKRSSETCLVHIQLIDSDCIEKITFVNNNELTVYEDSNNKFFERFIIIKPVKTMRVD